jgi:signal transduction histidine kinase
MSLSGSIKKFFTRFSDKQTVLSDSSSAAEYNYLKKRVDFLEKLLEEKTQCVDNAKSIFLKNLYHEIRTPLNAIVGFSDLIELNSISDKEKNTYVAHIRESSKDFLRKMDNIIEASIIEAGLLKISNESCRLYEIMTEIYAYFSIQKHIGDKSVALLLSVPDNLKGIDIVCDSYRLSQILTNLLSNAFKFTQHGIIEYGFTLQNNELEFFVKDSGVGGLDGKEDVIFENFTKLDETDNAQEGLGLGLGLSKKLVELMGGRIWYKSVATRGTSFYFTLPYKSGTSALGDSANEEEARILIPTFRKTIRRSVVL